MVKIRRKIVTRYTKPLGDADHLIKELQAQVEAASKTCSTLVFAMIAACLFSLLTCGTFSDAQLISNAAVTASIPGLGLSLPVQRYIQAAPWLLLAVQVYFLVNLAQYDSLIRKLVAACDVHQQDPSTKVYPSLFNSLVPQSMIDRDRGRFELMRLEPLLAVFLAYVVIPLSIWVVWFRSLALHGLLSIASTTLAMAASIFCSVMESTQQCKTPTIRAPVIRESRLLAITFGLGWSSPLVLLSLGFWFYLYPDYLRFDGWSIAAELSAISLLVLAVLVVVVFWNQPNVLDIKHNRRRWIFFMALIYFAVGVCVICQTFYGNLDESGTNFVKRWVIHFETARLGTAEISKRPLIWNGGDGQGELAAVGGVRLKNQDLRYVYAFQVFAINSRIENSNLEGAYFFQSDLRQVSFRRSDLSEASLYRADCSGADFGETKTDGIDLRGTDLRGAKISSGEILLAKRVDDTTRVSDPMKLVSCRQNENIVTTLCDDHRLIRNWPSEPPKNEEKDWLSDWIARRQSLQECAPNPSKSPENHSDDICSASRIGDASL